MGAYWMCRSEGMVEGLLRNIEAQGSGCCGVGAGLLVSLHVDSFALA